MLSAESGFELQTKKGRIVGLFQQLPRARRVKQTVTRQRARVTRSEAGMVTADDRKYIQQALDLAKRALGKTDPNPAVGCVIVKEGQVIGEGYHPKAGEPHAEVFALRAAGQEAEGATAYVTLEPCNHYGQTPPCSKALVAARVARVVVGVGDPNPLVGGAGIKTLQQAGIEVAKVGGSEEAECHSINAAFMERMTQGS